MDFRFGHDLNIGFHQTSRFTLTNERRRSCDDSLGTRDIQSFEEEPSKVLDNPLHNAEIKKHLHNCDEEDGGRKLWKHTSISVCYLLSVPTVAHTMTYSVDKKPVLRIDGFLVEEKGSTDETLIEKVGCKSRNPLEYA